MYKDFSSSGSPNCIFGAYLVLFFLFLCYGIKIETLLQLSQVLTGFVWWNFIWEYTIEMELHSIYCPWNLCVVVLEKSWISASSWPSVRAQWPHCGTGQSSLSSSEQKILLFIQCTSTSYSHPCAFLEELFPGSSLLSHCSLFQLLRADFSLLWSQSSHSWSQMGMRAGWELH